MKLNKYKRLEPISKTLNISLLILSLFLIGCKTTKKLTLVGGKCYYEDFNIVVYYFDDNINTESDLKFKDDSMFREFNLEKDFFKKQLPQINLKQLKSGTRFILGGKNIVKGTCNPEIILSIREYETR